MLEGLGFEEVCELGEWATDRWMRVSGRVRMGMVVGEGWVNEACVVGQQVGEWSNISAWDEWMKACHVFANRQHSSLYLNQRGYAIYAPRARPAPVRRRTGAQDAASQSRETCRPNAAETVV